MGLKCLSRGDGTPKEPPTLWVAGGKEFLKGEEDMKDHWLVKECSLNSMLPTRLVLLEEG